MDEKNPAPEHNRPPTPRWLLLAWLLFFVPFLFLVARAPGAHNEVSYSVFGRELAANNIERVEVRPNAGEIRGKFRRAVTIDGTDVETFRTALPFTDPAPVVAKLEEHNVPIEAKASDGDLVRLLVSLLPWVVLIGIWMFIFRRIQAGGQQALAIGRSGARPLEADRPRVTFADVAGSDEAKQELQEIIEFLREPSRFQRLGGRLPKGVLLVGPPGTGKTLLAKAVAGESGRPFFSMSGSDFVEMFVGVGAARIRDLFEKGKAAAPSIIFIDELDAVGRQRGTGLGGGHDEREQTLNQLLVELDGFGTDEGVILLAATNRPDVLDPALLRPGRFDRHVVVDLPDVRAREQILTVHARKIRLKDDVDLTSIARGTPGLSGADLANITNEAALLASRRGKDAVDMQDFDDARDKVMLGVERKSLVLTEEDRRITAYHEGGHALVTVLTPGLDPLQKVTIVPRGQALGVTFALPETDRRNLTRDYLEKKLTVAYAGRVAEELVFGPDKITTGASNDFRQATEIARRMVTEFGMSDVAGRVTYDGGSEQVFLGRELVQRREVSEHTAELIDAEVRQLADAAYKRARELLGANREALDAVAAELLETETLDGARVEELVADRRSPRHPPVLDVEATKSGQHAKRTRIG